MLPDSLPPEYDKLSPVWKLIAKEGLWAAISWFDTPQIATITEIPTHIWWEDWKWIKLPYPGTHIRGEKNESILHLPEWYGAATVISIGLSVLDAIAKNLPEKSAAKYSLFQRVWILHCLNWGEWAWNFHFPDTEKWWEGFVLSPNRLGVNPYDVTA